VLGVAPARPVEQVECDEPDGGKGGRAAGQQQRQGTSAAQHQAGDDERRQDRDGVPVRQAHARAGDPEEHQPARRLLQPPDQTERGPAGRQHGQAVAAGLHRLLQHQRAAGEDDTGQDPGGAAGEPGDRAGDQRQPAGRGEQGQHPQRRVAAEAG
jgi:hypothetical protein